MFKLTERIVFIDKDGMQYTESGIKFCFGTNGYNRYLATGNPHEVVVTKSKNPKYFDRYGRKIKK